LTAAKNGDSSALFRLNLMSHVMTKFTESEEYHDKPTEGEETVEREQERRAEIEALEREIAAAQEESEAKPQSEEEDAEKPAEAENKAAKPEDHEETVAVEKGKPDAEERERAPRVAEHKTVSDEPNSVAAEPKKVDDLSCKPEKPAVTPPSPGHRAYMEQRSIESRQRRRVDTEA